MIGMPSFDTWAGMNRRRFKMEIQDPGDFEPGGVYALIRHEDFKKLHDLLVKCGVQVDLPFWSMTINRDDAYDA